METGDGQETSHINAFIAKASLSHQLLCNNISLLFIAVVPIIDSMFRQGCQCI